MAEDAYEQRKELFREPTKYVPIESAAPISIRNFEEGKESSKVISEVPAIFRPGEAMFADGKYYKMEPKYEEGKPNTRENIVGYKAQAITDQNEADAARFNSQRIDNLVLEKYPRG